MHKDIKNWCKECISCQKSKVTRHTVLNPIHFSVPEGRFKHIHIDLVGPLPTCEGYSYLLTCIDRFSRWPEAIPLRDIESVTICRAFTDGWIARFGSPETVTTDQGKQFESKLFTALLQLNGCKRNRTTPYHPAANGMVERWHRSLKSAIMCHMNKNWIRTLPVVLMGLRNNILDSGASPAEYLYGKALRIPREFVVPEDFSVDKQVFLEEFRENMRMVKPVPVTHKHKRKIFIYKSLDTCSHVFLKIVKRNVSVENVKPAYSVREDVNENVLPVNSEIQTRALVPSHTSNPLPNSNILSSPTLRTYVNKKKKVSFDEGTKS